MIGSFWNFCRACPSMPVDKLHSEYRSTYRWHEYTGPRQEVVRWAPQAATATAPVSTGGGGEATNAKPMENGHVVRMDEPSTEMAKLEPAMPRRKKHPDLAYRHHEFIAGEGTCNRTGGGGTDGGVAAAGASSGGGGGGGITVFGIGGGAATAERARSEWRRRQRRDDSPSSRRRSKSEGRRHYTVYYYDHDDLLKNGGAGGGGEKHRRDSDPPDIQTALTVRESSLLRKAISKINTEYRLQFAWPHGGGASAQRDAAGGSAAAPRKSKSMGALKQPAHALVHHRHKRTDFENRDASELEPLVSDHQTIREEEGGDIGGGGGGGVGVLKNGVDTEYNKNFRPFSQYEYTEGRFKTKLNEDEAVEEITSKIVNGGLCQNGKDWYREVVELRRKAGEYKNRGWSSKVSSEKVTDIYKKQEELWDQVSKRSSLSALSLASTTHKLYTKEEKEQENTKKSSPTKALRNAENTARMKDMLRHHLERTTGVSEFDGLILSPTRDKLEPTIPRRDDDSRGSQKNSPKKSSPQKFHLQKKNSQKSKNVVRTARSQSVGPADMSTEKKSPKRQSRATTAATTKEKRVTTTPSSTATGAAVTTTKRPRPSSLNTTASSRSKSSSVPPKTTDDRTLMSRAKPTHSSIDTALAHNKNSARGKSATEGSKDDTTGIPQDQAPVTVVTGAPSDQSSDKQSVDTTAPAVDLEPVVKSPPEPTRVKSPEQIMMRSPDPVNWTVPLDTGKTFTVTQNIRGDLGNRPHSEIKAWTPPDIPLPVAQSAPPHLPPDQQHKDSSQQQQPPQQQSQGMSMS